MTEKARGPECGWCRVPLGSRAGPGRPRRFCRPACRQAAYRARRLAGGHGLADGEVIVREASLQELADAQFVLTAALEDVAVDLAEATSRAEVEATLAHLVEVCGPLAGLRLQPLTDR